MLLFGPCNGSVWVQLSPHLCGVKYGDIEWCGIVSVSKTTCIQLNLYVAGGIGLFPVLQYYSITVCEVSTSPTSATFTTGTTGAAVGKQLQSVRYQCCWILSYRVSLWLGSESLHCAVCRSTSHVCLWAKPRADTFANVLIHVIKPAYTDRATVVKDPTKYICCCALAPLPLP